jgi:uncharacterized protein
LDTSHPSFCKGGTDASRGVACAAAMKAVHSRGRRRVVPRRLFIKGYRAAVEVRLENGPTAKEIWDRLPIEAEARLWGEEIYFPIPVSTEPEPAAREEVEVGDVGYWPPGNALCLFFGRTPASTNENPRAASPVTVVGKIVGGIEGCRLVQSGEKLSVESAQA